jgi:hypothetical protein
MGAVTPGETIGTLYNIGVGYNKQTNTERFTNDHEPSSIVCCPPVVATSCGNPSGSHGSSSSKEPDSHMRAGAHVDELSGTHLQTLHNRKFPKKIL